MLPLFWDGYNLAHRISVLMIYPLFWDLISLSAYVIIFCDPAISLEPLIWSELKSIFRVWKFYFLSVYLFTPLLPTSLVLTWYALSGTPGLGQVVTDGGGGVDSWWYHPTEVEVKVGCSVNPNIYIYIYIFRNSICFSFDDWVRGEKDVRWEGRRDKVKMQEEPCF